MTPLALEPLAGIDAVRTDWSRLALASGNPFTTPEWCEAWLAHAVGGCDVRLLGAARADGSLAAILPLVVVRGRAVRKGRFLGFKTATEIGPIAAPGDAEPAAEALRRAISGLRREWDVFVADNLPGHGWTERLGGMVVARSGSPVVRGAWDGWDGYLASRSRNFRQELRRKERRLAERGGTYRAVTSARELDAALDVLFDLHRARWGEDASPWFSGQERFHRAFAAAALAQGWLRLRLLELDGRPVAAYYGFRFGPAEWFYQLGRRPDASGSSGLLLVAHAIREALGEGAAEFRLGRGAQDYKLRFATGDPGVETIGVASTLRGRASVLATRRRG